MFVLGCSSAAAHRCWQRVTVIFTVPCNAAQVEEVLPMRTADDLGVWERLDDVIMGGQSDSDLRPAEGGGDSPYLS